MARIQVNTNKVYKEDKIKGPGGIPILP